MKKPLFLYLTSALVCFAACFTAIEATAQTVPNVNVSDLTTAGYNTGAGMQNATAVSFVANNGETFIVIRSTSAATTATIVTQAKSVSQAGYGTAPLSDQTVSVPANSVVMAGPFPTGRWNNPYGHVAVSLTTTTGVSISAINVPQ